MLNRVLISILFLIICSVKLNAQESSIYENYYLNTFIINPAVTGSEYYPVVNLSAKKQWLGFKDAPTTYLLSGNFKIGNYDFYDPKKFINKGRLKIKERIGMGAALFKDNSGPVSNTGGLLSYAYHIPLRNNYFSFGLSIIETVHSINSSDLKPDQPNDNYLITGNNTIYRTNANFGVYFHNDSYFCGLSANKIFRDVSDDYFVLKSTPSFFLIGGYKFLKDNQTISFEPSIVLKRNGDDYYGGDFHLKIYVRQFNWIAFSYNSLGKMNIRLGLRVYKKLYVGYNFEQTLSNIAKYSYGSHEINIGINLGLISVKGIKDVVN